MVMAAKDFIGSASLFEGKSDRGHISAIAGRRRNPFENGDVRPIRIAQT
jgi:hypothetical protein